MPLGSRISRFIAKSLPHQRPLDVHFEYSTTMREAGRRGLTRTAETLDRFLGDPEAMIPGVRMGGVRLRDPAERRMLIQWLQARAK